jgi:hypothetical protein
MSGETSSGAPESESSPENESRSPLLGRAHLLHEGRAPAENLLHDASRFAQYCEHHANSRPVSDHTAQSPASSRDASSAGGSPTVPPKSISPEELARRIPSSLSMRAHDDDDLSPPPPPSRLAEPDTSPFAPGRISGSAQRTPEFIQKQISSMLPASAKPAGAMAHGFVRRPGSSLVATAKQRPFVPQANNVGAPTVLHTPPRE